MISVVPVLLLSLLVLVMPVVLKTAQLWRYVSSLTSYFAWVACWKRMWRVPRIEPTISGLSAFIKPSCSLYCPSKVHFLEQANELWAYIVFLLVLVDSKTPLMLYFAYFLLIVVGHFFDFCESGLKVETRDIWSNMVRSWVSTGLYRQTSWLG